jgi:spoIIIJ-associated protein
MFIPMETWDQIIKKILSGMGFIDYRVELAEDGSRNAAFIYENEVFIKENLPMIVESINHLLQMIAKKNATKPIFLDINNYRQEREGLIAELARAAAKKVSTTKQEVSLPAMNSYERRIVHVELAIHPDVKTESIGEGKERYIVIKPITNA